jgi:hypothetical protein
VSAETKAALDHAISAHFGDVMDGAIVTGYLLQMSGESIADMDANQWSALREVADEQQFLTTLGLSTFVVRSLESQMMENEA